MFLASKTLEQPRHLEPICGKLYLIHMNKKVQAHSNLQVPPLSPAMLHDLKRSIILSEFLLLEEIGFNTAVKLPYKHITRCSESLCIPPAAKNNFLRIAYRFANDFSRTSAPLVKSHYNIAEACLFLASKTLKFDLGIQPDQETLQILNLAVKIECIH